MSKCSKSKRPCKICLGTVNQRNGLQCQGACQSWVHYSCLNYTPGKIKDIKNGIIRVTCPCPDCKTILPKEYRTDQPFSCTNQMCPANRPPKCENVECPINDSERRVVPQPTCPLGKCGTSCKQFSTPQSPYGTNMVQPRPLQPCVPLPPEPPRQPPSDGCLDPNRCSSGCSTPSANPSPPPLDLPGDCGASPMRPSPISAVPSLRAVEEMCNTIGLLTNQLNDLMSKMHQFAAENQPDTTNLGGVLRGYRPGTAPPTRPIPPPPPEQSCNCRVRSKKKLI